jgi:holliday junction DNA helicase RuvA
MIGYLQGEVLDHSAGNLIVGVGDRTQWGIVGYEVAVPQNLNFQMIRPGQKIELFVYSHVREDSFDLYGFSSPAEKALFLTLLSVNGIGPKSALGMLSGVDSEQLINAIILGDKAFLTGIPGIGKKTAERIVVELKDTVQKKVEQGVFGHSFQKTAKEGLGSEDGAPSADVRSKGHSNSMIYQDAKAALIHLGYREQEVQTLLNRVLENQESLPRKAEELVRIALRQMI